MSQIKVPCPWSREKTSSMQSLMIEHPERHKYPRRALPCAVFPKWCFKCADPPCIGKNFLLRQQQESCTPHSMVVSCSTEYPLCQGHGHSWPVLVVSSSPIGQPQVCPGAILPSELLLWEQPGPFWGHPSQGSLQATSPKSQISTAPPAQEQEQPAPVGWQPGLHMDLGFLMALVTGRLFMKAQPFNVLRICLCNGSIVSSHQADMKI